MKLSFSNLAWLASQDEIMYEYLQSIGFEGVEIAPTRIFPEKPYEYLAAARKYAQSMNKNYGLGVSSLQSILYGRGENIFNGLCERHQLIEYTKKAIDFAAAIGCGNLVFGCPKNRNMPDNADKRTAFDFFSEIADYAVKLGTRIAIEPNPLIYGTNFINTTTQAFEFAKQIMNLRVNIDCGTIITNGEDVRLISDHIELVNHVHISEPNLARIERRCLHKDLSEVLRANGYDKYVSIEMKNVGDMGLLKYCAEYVKGIFI